jgi:hypothetical protein
MLIPARVQKDQRSCSTSPAAPGEPRDFKARRVTNSHFTAIAVKMGFLLLFFAPDLPVVFSVAEH